MDRVAAVGVPAIQAERSDILKEAVTVHDIGGSVDFLAKQCHRRMDMLQVPSGADPACRRESVPEHGDAVLLPRAGTGTM
jgi:hypothetical protein